MVRGQSLRLVIATGASRDLGAAYLDHYRTTALTTCLGLHRSVPSKKLSNVQYRTIDLLDAEACHRVFAAEYLERFGQIVLLHPVGMFKWEEKRLPVQNNNGDEIDKEILDSNISTFDNIWSGLIGSLRDNNLESHITCAAFGSLSDGDQVPYWLSYSRAKNQLRQRIREIAETHENVFTRFISLPSVMTRNEQQTRPFADCSYWMTPEEVVVQTVEEIEDTSVKYKEICRYKFSPHFTSGYYSDHEQIYRNWHLAMHGFAFPNAQ